MISKETILAAIQGISNGYGMEKACEKAGIASNTLYNHAKKDEKIAILFKEAKQKKAENELQELYEKLPNILVKRIVEGDIIKQTKWDGDGNVLEVNETHKPCPTPIFMEALKKFVDKFTESAPEGAQFAIKLVPVEGNYNDDSEED